MKPRREDTETGIREQAAAWVSELEETGPRKPAECLSWLKESPEHVKEFLFMTAMWEGLGGVDAQRRMDLDKLLEEASAKVVSLGQGLDQEQPRYKDHGNEHKETRRRSWWLAGAAAAVAAIAVTMGLTIPMFSGGHEYATAVGEQRIVKLADGSMINMNTRSRIEVRLSEHAREVRLLAGEVLFTVAHDLRRPFRVQAGEAVVQALGTQFNVYRRARETTVSVVEGAVLVSGAGQESPAPATRERIAGPKSARTGQKITAGEQISVTSGGALNKPPQPDIEKAIAWRKRQLIFRGDPLETVAAEVNRYNEGMQLRIEGRARERRLIGVFAADDPESLVQFLAQEGDVVVEKKRAETVIRSRR